MINYKTVQEIRDIFVSNRKNLSEKEIEETLGFFNKRDKILSLFSIRLKPNKKLINEGVVVYCYAYKNQYFVNENSNFYKSWIIYSPNYLYEEKPAEYSKIAAKLEYFLESKNKKHIKLIRRLQNDDNNFAFEELPREIFNDAIYISTIYTKEKINPNLHVGVLPCLINRKLTKTTLIIPEFYLKTNVCGKTEKVEN